MTTTAPVPWLCPRDHTCPNVRSHDTYSAHRYGCRSGAARHARYRYDKQIGAGLHPHRLIPAGPYTRRLQCLAARGWRAEDIAQHTPLSRSQLVKVLTYRALVTQATARQVDDVFRELWMRDGPSSLARVRAVNRGWAPAGCYDNIDNMDELPKLGGVRDRSIPGQHRGNTLDRRATIARLYGQGESLEQIGWAVGITPRSVSRHLAALRDGQQAEAS